jgi:8-oxo-dGTP diphosphatase
MASQNPPTISPGLKRAAVLCVLKNGNRFMLLKRLKEPNKDCYTPVGGKLDPHESPYQAALRETWEETGIKVEKMHFAGILTETSPVNYNWINYVYWVEIDYLIPPPCNEGTLEWISFEQVPDIPTPKTDWHIYDYLIRQKTFVFNAIFDESLRLIKMEDEIEGVVLV